MSSAGIDRLELYNVLYNDFCAAMPHGMPASMEELQVVALESMLLTMTAGAEARNRKSIKISEILDLVRRLRSQNYDTLTKHK